MRKIFIDEIATKKQAPGIQRMRLIYIENFLKSPRRHEFVTLRRII